MCNGNQQKKFSSWGGDRERSLSFRCFQACGVGPPDSDLIGRLRMLVKQRLQERGVVLYVPCVDTLVGDADDFSDADIVSSTNFIID